MRKKTISGHSGKDVFVLICCVCFVLVSLSAASAAYSHLDHPCSGEGCPACVQIRGALNFLRQVGSSGTGPWFILGALLAVRGPADPVSHRRFSSVVLKVRLNT